MGTDVKSAIRHACRLLLRPTASLLMKCGMTWKEFSEISKSVFVDVASEEFGIRGRPTNVSRVSILTGISRKEIKRQRDLLAAIEVPVLSKTSDATRALSGWHQDPDYLDDDGNPLPLPEYGPVPSFESLFGRYGGDTPQQTLLKELSHAGSIVVGADGKLVAKTRYHMPSPMNEVFIQFLGTNLYDHAQTLNNNIATDSSTKSRFEGFAVDDRIDADAKAEFKEFIDLRAEKFLEEVDDWLNEHRAEEGEGTDTSTRLGVGVYAIDGALPTSKKK